LHARSFRRVVEWDSLCARAASLAGAARRAEQAEQQLAAVHASHSWTMTAPLRWLRSHVS
jgi:hypothetical protein